VPASAGPDATRARGESPGTLDWRVVRDSGGEVRAQTRRPLRVGQIVSCDVSTPGGRRPATGRVTRCEVSTITADSVTYEVDVMLDETTSRADVVPDPPGIEDQPDLDSLFEVIEDWDPCDER
jgi:hypothetical protein